MPLSLLPIIFSGPGSNLYPLCDASSSAASASKALLPVANRPLIAYALQSLLSAGLTSTLLLAPASQHAAITKVFSTIKLIPPTSPALQGEKRKAREVKDEKKSIGIVVVENLSHSTNEATTMKVELLGLGPYDGKDSDKAVGGSDFRRQNLGTAELLRWVASIGKLEADPLIVPIDMISPSMPLRDLIDVYVNAQMSSQGTPTACCALYERGAGDGTGRERERDGPPRTIAAFSNEAKGGKRLLLLRDAEISTDMTFRKSLLQACPRLRLSTRLLDSHVYILNRTQVIPLLEANPALTSLREHVMPLIAKASWMQGLQEKADWSLGKLSAEEEDDDHDEDESVSKRLAKLSRDTFLTRQVVERSSMQASNTHRSRHSWQSPVRCLTVVSRLQQAEEGTSALPCFVARANTVATYLECNRWLLKAQSSSAPLHFALPTVAVEHVDVTSSTGEPLQASSAQISPDSIIGVGVRIGDRASIKRTVVGNRCEVGRGARLSGCILLDGSKVLENARLENVIVCAGAVIGERSTLKECDVAAGVTIAADTNAKNEKLVGEDDDEDGDASEEED